MSRTLSQILTDANSTLDLEAALPTGDELTLRQNYANQAVEDAAGVAQFSEFDVVYEVNTTTLATISLPTGFRELKTNPRILDSTGNWREYEEILPHDKYNYLTSDKYCMVLGNPQEGYSLYLNSVLSGATLSIIYQRYPSGMATLTDVCELSDATFVTRKIESYVLYSRGDERLSIAESRAQQRLQNMVGRDMKTPGGGARTTPSGFKNPLS